MPQQPRCFACFYLEWGAAIWNAHNTASYTFAKGVISHGDSIGVIAYSGAGGTGCTDSASVTISLNTISSTTLSQTLKPFVWR